MIKKIFAGIGAVLGYTTIFWAFNNFDHPLIHFVAVGFAVPFTCYMLEVSDLKFWKTHSSTNS